MEWGSVTTSLRSAQEEPAQLGPPDTSYGVQK